MLTVSFFLTEESGLKNARKEKAHCRIRFVVPVLKFWLGLESRPEYFCRTRTK